MKERSTVPESHMAHFPHHMVNSLHIYLYRSASLVYVQVFLNFFFIVNPSQIFGYLVRIHVKFLAHLSRVATR